jgi:hypothetical protein
MQAQLAPFLSLNQCPVVVPVGKQVDREDRDGLGADVFTQGHAGLNQAMSELSCIADVDDNAFGKTELVRGYFDDGALDAI